MTVDRSWIKRNLGFDPTTTNLPGKAFASAPAGPVTSVGDIQREIIDFDSEAPHGKEFLAFTTATGLSRFTDIPWPKRRLAPETASKLPGRAGGPLPRADVLVVTWTVDEGHALSRVLTPGRDSRNDYQSYTHNFHSISKKMRAGCPAVEAGRLGAFWTTSIGGTSVVVFKSDSHMSQDGPQLPNIEVWKQIIEEVQPKLVITTGTVGGIGREAQVGDVTASAVVRFDCTAKFKHKPFAKMAYRSDSLTAKYFATAKQLFKANAGQLPRDNNRAPRILRVAPGMLASSVVTTDFFGFDTSDNHYQLKGPRCATSPIPRFRRER
jgi:hypothetical protein